jgi:hypothetical protein
MFRQNGLPEDVAEDDIVLGHTRYRLGIRAVTGATNERALVVSVIPRMVFAGNSILVSVPVRDELREKNWVQVENYNSRRLLFACAVLSGYVPDWFIRQKILTNMNMFFIYEIPVPRLVETDAAFWPIAERAARLICTTPEFDDLAKEARLSGHKDGATDADERAKLRAELDGLIAHLYGLTKDEFAYVLTTFPLVEQPVKDAALAAYQHFAPKPLERQIDALLAAGESATAEFKSSARWDRKENRLNKVLEQVIVKTVAAFLNSEGGTLLIGVGDDKKPLGLADDYKTLGKRQDRDGYENWLTTLLLDSLGKETNLLIRIKFCEFGGCDICVVDASPSPKPVYVKEANAENLHIRTGNSTRLLTSREAVEYVKQHWK